VFHVNQAEKFLIAQMAFEVLLLCEPLHPLWRDQVKKQNAVVEASQAMI
jgi:hypothetical protein